MSATEDGGPAFAVPRPHTDAGTGISKRDWFAGQAIGECFKQALGAGPPTHIDEYTHRAAFWAYALADAMLEERKLK